MAILVNKGTLGEDIAVTHLTKNKFSIKERNFYSRTGEIDIIAQKKDLIVFVEVKLRSSKQVDLAELIPLYKQRKIIATSQLYLSRYNEEDYSYRFDVALIHLYRNKEYSCQYIPNAFTYHE